ncbi:hypothetical protein VVD49_16250 [Uliginosibacterium sp. H3]|uniref:Uncharacterized protein n=1 Tax=Uliginosibacterium silvisoli TaxID=3114758 RepID=A0ABU6K6K6_9RHOO|nr:hypothetical protein [Uliginosibacterium sp. H3]
MSGTKLDDHRIELTWKAGRALLKTEIRFSCSGKEIEQVLNEAGFEKYDGKWLFPANGQNTLATVVKTSTWTGFSGTTFQGNVCRSVVGTSIGSSMSFTLDYCISEQEYEKSSRQFERIERSVTLGTNQK